MPDDNPLPPMSEGILGADQLADLLRDLAACAQIDEIRFKSGPGRVPPQTDSPTLDDVARLLHERAVRGVQVRYRFQGAHWCDTLMPVPAGTRVVRIRQDDPQT